MTIDTSYQDYYPFLFSGNAGEVTISGLSEGDAADITITTYLGTSLSFSMAADGNGRVVLDLSALLSSLNHLMVISPALAWTMLTFTFTVSGTTVTKEWKVLAGRSTRAFIEEIYNNRRFISARPQIYPIGIGNEVYLCLYSAETPSVKATVYTDIAPLGFEVAYESTSAFYLEHITVSCAAVRKILDDSGYGSHSILAFDIFSEASDGTRSESLRFVVDYGGREEFRFIGSLGTGENILAYGIRKSEVESDVASFINGKVERELANDSKIVHESFTGHLKSAEEVRYWQEFFASSERYDGEGRRIIIDDIDSEAAEGELSAFSFKWHYADRDADPARVPVRQTLKAYNSEVLWYESEAEAEKIVGKTGLQGVKVTGDSGESILPNDADGYAELKINSPLTHDADGMGVDGSAVGSAIEITDLTV